MSAPKIRTDYDGLQQVAQTFWRQAEGSRRLLHTIKSQKDVLVSDDWVGQDGKGVLRRDGLGGPSDPTSAGVRAGPDAVRVISQMQQNSG
jgi:hypothetical protein